MDKGLEKTYHQRRYKNGTYGATEVAPTIRALYLASVRPWVQTPVPPPKKNGTYANEEIFNIPSH
jgi:hypothetical protein